MIKKLRLYIFVILFLFSIISNSFLYTFANEFDLPLSQKELAQLYEIGLYKGFEIEAENINKPLKRGEAVLLLMNWLPDSKKLNHLGKIPFVDIDELSTEIQEAVSIAYSMEIFSGIEFSDGLYAYGLNEITREEFVSLLGKLLGISSDNAVEFNDSSEISPWALKYVSGLTSKDIIKIGQNNFEPKSIMSRNEASRIFYDLMFIELPAGEIAQFAGAGNSGYADSKKMTSLFYHPIGLTVYKNNELAVADSENHMIRIINSKRVSTIAGYVKGINDGTKSAPLYLDGDPKEALLGIPNQLLYDKTSDILYFTDKSSNVIRMIDSNNTVNTLSGNGEAGYVNGSKEEARFNSPSGIAKDTFGNIFIADTLNHCIRKIDPDGNVTTFAGTGNPGYVDGDLESARFNEPYDIVINKNGDMYVSDSVNCKIRKISGNTVKTIETIFHGPFEIEAFNYPKGMDVSENGVIYVADYGNHVIKAITNEIYVSKVAGSGKAGNFDPITGNIQLNQPTDVVYLDGTLYIADKYNNAIKKISFTKNMQRD